MYRYSITIFNDINISQQTSYENIFASAIRKLLIIMIPESEYENEMLAKTICNTVILSGTI